MLGAIQANENAQLRAGVFLRFGSGSLSWRPPTPHKYKECEATDMEAGHKIHLSARLVGAGLMCLALALAANFLWSDDQKTGSAVPARLHDELSKKAVWPRIAASLPRSGQSLSSFGLPIRFEPNVGQAAPVLKYIGHASGMRIGLLESDVVIDLASAQPTGAAQVRLELVDANENPVLRAEQPQVGVSNFLVGNDPSRWKTGVRNYGAVRYQEVYPGVDLVVYGNGQHLEYDFVLAPHTDVGQIQLAFEGADRISVNESGDLLIDIQGHILQQFKPVIYQTLSGGERQIVEGRYTVDRERRSVAFEVETYDHDRSLVIDPAVSHSTFIGGTDADVIRGIAVDAAGNIYVAGQTNSADYPTRNPVQPEFAFGFSDATVAKLDPTGSSLIYATYLGGSGLDGAEGIAVNSAGEAYVAGATQSFDFPTVNALQPDFRGLFNGEGNAFIAKLDATGSSLLYSTYLGGSGSEAHYGGDIAYGIAVDAAGVAYVAGQASSLDFPTASPLQDTNTGAPGAFVAALSSDGSSLVYSTYLTGIGYATAFAVAADMEGHAFVTGYVGGATDPMFPIVNAYQPVAPDGDNAFLSKFAPDGSELIYSTYLGGYGSEVGFGIALDNVGSAYITGVTTASDFPIINAVQDEHGGLRFAGDEDGADSFVSKFSPDGRSLLYSTYLGGDRLDVSRAIAVDTAGSAYVVGDTRSADFPLFDALQCEIVQRGTAGDDDRDGFVTKLSPSGNRLEYSTFLGGEKLDQAKAAAIGARGQLHVAGWTASSLFPTVIPIQNINRAVYETAFIATLENSDRSTQPPLYPTGVAALAGDEQITLTWEVCVPETSYTIYVGTESGGQGALPVQSGITGNSATLSGLANNTTYYLEVVGVNAAGEGERSVEVSATPFLEVPAQVTGVTLTARVRSLQIDWAAAARADRYRVYVRTLTGVETTHDVPGAPTSYVALNLLADQPYVIQVAGINDSGLGQKSVAVRASPLEPDTGGGGGGGSIGYSLLAWLGLIVTLRRASAGRLSFQGRATSVKGQI